MDSNIVHYRKLPQVDTDTEDTNYTGTGELEMMTIFYFDSSTVSKSAIISSHAHKFIIKVYVTFQFMVYRKLLQTIE